MIFGNDEEPFDGYDDFVPEHLPEPGAFLNKDDEGVSEGIRLDMMER